MPGSHRDGEASGGLATIDELGTVGIVVGGAGAVALIAALVTGILAHDQYQSLEERCGPDGRACPLGSQGDIDAGSGLALTSTVTTFTGLALVAAGAAVLVVDLTSNDSRGERHEARLGIGAGGRPGGGAYRAHLRSRAALAGVRSTAGSFRVGQQRHSSHAG